MRRLFLTATIGMGLISTSYPAIASQSIDPCHKQCSKYYKNNTYGDCRNACDVGKVYTAPAKNSSTASPAPASKDSAAAPMNNERIKRLRELRERSKGSAGEAQANVNTGPSVERRRIWSNDGGGSGTGGSSSSSSSSSSLKEKLGDFLKGAVKGAIKGAADSLN